MTEELKDKELTDIKYLRSRMTGNVGLAIDHAYNLGFFDGEKNLGNKIIEYLNNRAKLADTVWVSLEIQGLQKYIQDVLKTREEGKESDE